MTDLSNRQVLNQQLVGTADLSSQAAKYLPEPAVSSGGGGLISGALSGITSLTTNVLNQTTGNIAPADIGSFKQLLDQQMEAQMVMQYFSSASNIERTKHEARMTAVRNIRLG